MGGASRWAILERENNLNERVRGPIEDIGTDIDIFHLTCFILLDGILATKRSRELPAGNLSSSIPLSLVRIALECLWYFCKHFRFG